MFLQLQAHIRACEQEAAVGSRAEAPGIADRLTRCRGFFGSLERDLDFLHGPAWRSQLGITAACQDYLYHLQHLSVADPERLVAHAYVRYLGDLSGGQQLKGIVARSLLLPVGRGVDPPEG